MDDKWLHYGNRGRSRPLKVKMDALVHDLSEALKDSSCAPSGRAKVGFRRRTRSAGNLALLVQKPTHSDDSISERRPKECQSDSDEVSANSIKRLVPYQLKKRPPHLSNFEASYVESDSVNENFSPHRTDRRKRKMKRMDCDAVVGPVFPLPGPSGARVFGGKKKKVSTDLARMELDIGKRKRSIRERSSEMNCPRRLRSSRVPQCGGEKMEIEREVPSSSSLSSSESDPGLQTNDEGREGDDEQSDWFAETRHGDETDLETDDSTFHLLSQMTDEARQVYSDGLGERDREIRGGRRRVHDDWSGVSVLTSVSENLSSFLQNPQQITLRLHPMERNECDLISQFAKMYLLRMHLDISVPGKPCPVLTKTTATPRSLGLDPFYINASGSNESAHKRRRKLPHLHLP